MIELSKSPDLNPRTFAAKALLAAIQQMLQRSFFSTLPMHAFFHLLTEQENTFVRTLHCVHWNLIPDELKTELNRILCKVVNAA